jgi:hypothetical protein
MTSLATDQAPLEAVLKDEIIRMYQEVADKPRAPTDTILATARQRFNLL